MSRKSSKAIYTSQELERLASPVRLDGKGEDPVVKALLSDEFVKGTNAESLDVALALQQLIRGTNSILANQAQMADEQHKLQERMNAMDAAAAAWNEDKEKFAQNVFDRAEKLLATGMEKDRIIAQGAATFQAEVTKARAGRVSDNLSFAAELARMPKVKVISAGVFESQVINGQPVTKLISEVIRIKDKAWVLPINKEIEVPKVVADRMEELRKSREETQERQDVLARNLEGPALREAWDGIGRKYNTKADVIPI